MALPSNGMLDLEVWYYGADSVWFALGLPTDIWQDAVVVTSSIPGRLIVIPDKFFVGRLPLWLRIRRFLTGQWLPSMSKLLFV